MKESGIEGVIERARVPDCMVVRGGEGDSEGEREEEREEERERERKGDREGEREE